MKINYFNYHTVIFICLLSVCHKSSADIDPIKAEEMVKNTPCGQVNIEEALKNKIKTGSQRDLGWQIFKEGEFYEAERAFLMNKSMQLRFRWHINADNSVVAISKRAETLCTEP